MSGTRCLPLISLVNYLLVLSRYLISQSFWRFSRIIPVWHVGYIGINDMGEELQKVGNAQ